MASRHGLDPDTAGAIGGRHAAPAWLEMPIETIMLRHPVTTDVRARVRDVQALMNRTGAGHIPVLDGGRPVGVVTARDIARALPVPITMLRRDEQDRLLALPVGMVMSTPVVALPAAATVGMAIARTIEEGVGTVVVTGQDDHLIGLVTRSAIVALVGELPA